MIYEFFDEINENRKKKKQLQICSSLVDESHPNLLFDIDLQRDHFLKTLFLYEYFRFYSLPFIIKPEQKFFFNLFGINKNSSLTQILEPRWKQQQQQQQRRRLSAGDIYKNNEVKSKQIEFKQHAQTIQIRFRVNFNLNELKQIDSNDDFPINDKFSLNINLKLNI
jgi:hypothetical protein